MSSKTHTLSFIAKSPFFKGTAIFTVASLVVSIVNYIINLIIARGFSVAEYGEYASSFSYIALLGVPISAFSLFIIKKISSVAAHDRAAYALSVEHWLFSHLRESIVFLTTSALVSFFILTSVSNLSVVSLLFVFGFSFISVAISFFVAVFQADKKFLIAGVYLFGLAASKLLSGGFVIFFAPHLWLLYISQIVAMILLVFAGHRIISKEHQGTTASIRFLHPLKYLLKKEILLTLLSAVGLVGMLNIDIVVANMVLPAQTLGQYAALSLLAKIIFYLGGPVSTVSLSFFSSSSQLESKKVFILALGFLTVVGLICLFFYASFSHMIVFFIFGNKYIEIIPFVWLAGLFGLLYVIVSLCTQYFLSQNSKLSLLPLLGLVSQTIGLWLFHNSFFDIMLVNSVVTASVILLYIVSIRYAFIKTPEKKSGSFSQLNSSGI